MIRKDDFPCARYCTWLNVYRYIRLLILFIPISGTSQTVDLNQTVTFQFKNQPLGAVLSTISQQYQVPFAYNRDFVPINQRISVDITNASLREGLDALFSKTKVIYALIGGSIILRIDKTKGVAKESTLTETSIEPPKPKPKRDYRQLRLLKKESYALLSTIRPIPQIVLDSLQSLDIQTDYDIPNIYEDSPYRELTQVTLFPPISTTKEKPDSITNTFSLNILYGINGGLEGLEVGGLGNSIRNNMKGLQIAGIWNRVAGNMSGTQFASVANSNEGYTRGLQFTLGVNVTNETKAIQLAGLMNIVKEDFSGLQLAILGNYVRTRSNGIQVAGFFNKSDGSAYKQFALGYNKAVDVRGIQVGLVNVASYIKGNQIGLLNIATETNGTPIGLFNFIKKGYNRIEVSGGESLFANFGFKFGVRKFYNIIQFGYRFTNDNWSLGYGLGTGRKIKEKQHLHIEWRIAHVNEGTWWTNTKNWLHQVGLTYDWEIGERNTSLFIGPTFNWSISKITDKETAILTGSTLPSYTLIDTDRNKGVNWKIWFGATAGLRF